MRAPTRGARTPIRSVGCGGRRWKRAARDAIAALPAVAAARVGLQGTSLGGFVAVLAAGVDGAFEPVVLALVGAELAAILREGAAEAARLRRALRRAGYEGEALHRALARIEPARIAPRLDPGDTWLYSAAQDRVIPPARARALAEAARLPPAHHVWLWGGHHGAIVHLPRIAENVVRHVRGAPPRAPPQPRVGTATTRPAR